MRRSATAPVFQRQSARYADQSDDKIFNTIFDLRKLVSVTIRLLEIEQKGNTIENPITRVTIDKGSTKVSFLDIMKSLQTDIESVEKYSEDIYPILSRYDFKTVKANGFRSFLLIVNKCCLILLNHIRTLNTQNVLDWHKSIISDISAFSDCLHELNRCLFFLTEMKRLSNNGSSLFPSPDVYQTKEVQDLMDESDKLRQDVFFGKCLGFYYCNSAQRILQVLGSLMSGYADSFNTNKSGVLGVFNTFLQTVSSFWNPDTRGQNMASITRHATVAFTKQFWSLGELPLVLEAPNMILPPVEVAVNFNLPPVPFTVPSKYGDSDKSTNITVHPPKPSTNERSPNNIKLRLISLRLREGLNWINFQNSANVSQDKSFIRSFSSKTLVYKERSKYLLIHCHGGGFVAQSAKAHDIYLRSWAEHLDCPILSIDYSLAPEHPFPKALDECFYAVSWAIRNKRQLGCTSDAKVVLCGDSAGANLAICSTLKAIKEGLAVPDALFLAYIPALVSIVPSPARLLSSLDPLLPVGILVRCLLAYVGIDEEKFVTSIDENASVNSGSSPISLSKGCKFSNDINNIPSPLTKVRLAKIPDDPFMSPLLAEDELLSQLPPVSIMSSHFDPLLDDCVELCKRLDNVGVQVDFQVMHEIPHGFLNFVLLSRECEIGSQQCLRMIDKLFKKPVHFQ